jgi:hypothetical protein
VGEFISVERLWAILGEPSERRPKLREANALTHSRDGTEIGRSGRPPPGRCGDGTDRVSVLGGRNRVPEQSVESERPEALGERRPARDRARHGHRARPGRLDAHRRIGVRWRGPGRVEIVKLSAGPHESEGIAADARGHRLGDAEHGRCSERCVDGVSAPLEDPEPRAGGERLARGYHRFRRDGRRARRCHRERHGSVASHDRSAVRPLRRLAQLDAGTDVRNR